MPNPFTEKETLLETDEPEVHDPKRFFPNIIFRLLSSLFLHPASVYASTCHLSGFANAAFEDDDVPPGEGEVGSDAEEERSQKRVVHGVGDENEEEVAFLPPSLTFPSLPISLLLPSPTSSDPPRPTPPLSSSLCTIGMSCHLSSSSESQMSEEEGRSLLLGEEGEAVSLVEEGVVSVEDEESVEAVEEEEKEGRVVVDDLEVVEKR
ncbi:hypothetical protein F5876DRAFT_70039 [Lentinula aff. lateritia]|uniref:Uncharacterized protein n=1 Tax=Lentinula aff. lateritia TaxID=2804960 RepID=A0ACC1TLA7_9AGAR|nr:hypothetical protein F5876DRAFT_70039 [Lentinula aff. lateritia]